MYRAVLSLALTALLFSAGSAQDTPPNTDWAQWRGPNRDGVCTETGLLKEWPKDGPKLLWSAKEVNKGKNVGTGYSSVAIASGRIYTLGDRDGKQHLICLDEPTGKALWATPFSPTWGDGGPRCTPTVDGTRVYGMSPHGILVCAATEDGQILWKKDLKADFGGEMMSGWSYSESPLVDGDKLICTPGGKKTAMVALNKESGSVVWKCEIPWEPEWKSKHGGAGYASIVIANVGGIRQYITLFGQKLGLVGVDASNGKYLWHYEKMANDTANIPTAIVQDDCVFASTAYGAGAALIRLVPDGNGGIDAKEVYFLKANKLQNHHGGMVRLGDYVYGGHGHGDGKPFCLELKTGKFAWGPERGAGSGSAGVLYADGRLYFRYQDNTMALIEASPKSYNLISSFQLPKGTSPPGWQHPVIHGGKLFIRANDQLYCYDIKR
jgi:outer membrane protein assembly factor BamB